MVVAGAQMGVAFQAAVFAADDQRHFGVDFVAEHAVHHVGAGFFQPPRPVHIIGFVKARHQFDDYRYLLAGERGSHQRAR